MVSGGPQALAEEKKNITQIVSDTEGMNKEYKHTRLC
jgi:hypothetical protein